MFYFKLKIKKTFLFISLLLFFLLFFIVLIKFLNKKDLYFEKSLDTEKMDYEDQPENKNNEKKNKVKKKLIKYVEFNPTFEALEDTMKEDIESYGQEKHLSWIKTLSHLAIKYGGDFKKYKNEDLLNITQKIKSGEESKIIKNTKLYDYYIETYGAVLGGFLGVRKVKVDDKDVEKYGLKVYSPIAKTFPFSHYSDFGASRSYGFKRRHLGHDIMCAVGTPVISIETGIIEIMGWNKFGGWRIGIRSIDKKRYYYYAHLRQGRPFNLKLKTGDIVEAGDPIGYVGRTGYSVKEDVNNIDKSHLHLGVQLIFDESQKECNNEIWIDLYNITKLLEKNKSAVKRDAATKEFFRE